MFRRVGVGSNGAFNTNDTRQGCTLSDLRRLA